MDTKINIGDKLIPSSSSIYVSEKMLEPGTTYVVTGVFEEQTSKVMVLLDGFHSFLFSADEFYKVSEEKTETSKEDILRNLKSYRLMWLAAVEKGNKSDEAFNMGRINFFLDKLNMYHKNQSRVPDVT